MCADARSRGVAVSGPTNHGPALPVLDAYLDNYYLHATEYLDKIRQDLKDAGHWNVDPRISAGLGAGEICHTHTTYDLLPTTYYLLPTTHYPRHSSLYLGGGGPRGRVVSLSMMFCVHRRCAIEGPKSMCRGVKPRIALRCAVRVSWRLQVERLRGPAAPWHSEVAGQVALNAQVLRHRGQERPLLLGQLELGPPILAHLRRLVGEDTQGILEVALP